ncbi:MAG TPA: DUF6498-containing protein [Burkholderiales bacterium]|nr:DUF6498-containing protein [Burkholderiales bacterium]
MANARPERIRYTFRDDAIGATPVPLPERRMWPAGLVVGVFFLIFAGVEAVMIAKIGMHDVRGVFDLAFVLFELFWVIGWSVGVLILGGLTVLFLFYRESARIQGNRLLHVPALGPLKIVCEYELARIENLRLEPTKSGKQVRVRFDYGGRTARIGDAMHRVDAEDIVAQIERALPAAVSRDPAAPHPHADLPPSTGEEVPRPPPDVPASKGQERPALRGAGGQGWGWSNPSTIALLAANLLPLAGVLAFGWQLAHVMVLFWAESAIIGLYAVLRMFVVAKIVAVPASMFFVGHFGGFMAAHFMFVYGLFVRGLDKTGPEPPVGEALAEIFGPLWLALAALAVSHGVSFVVNFLGRREYEGASLKALMTAPYKRIFVMHLTIIFGGWLVMLFKTPVPALVLLVLLKIAVDTRAHVREHARAAPPSGETAT